MRRPIIALCLTAAALLGGCASAPISGYAWSRDDDAEGASLMLAADNAAPPLVALTCRPGSGAVDLTLTGFRRNGAVIELHVGKIWNRYAGAGLAEDGPDAPMSIRAQLSATDPVLVALGDTGELTVVQGDVRIHAPNAFAPAHDFLAVCRAP